MRRVVDLEFDTKTRTGHRIKFITRHYLLLDYLRKKLDKGFD